MLPAKHLRGSNPSEQPRKRSCDLTWRRHSQSNRVSRCRLRGSNPGGPANLLVRLLHRRRWTKTEKINERTKPSRSETLPARSCSSEWLCCFGRKQAALRRAVFDPADREEKATSSQIAQIFALADAVRAMAAAAVRFLTLSLHRMCSTCLQIVPVHALRITPIS